MNWARLDDGMPDHPRVRPLSDRAFRLYITAICHSARYLTDGVISNDVIAAWTRSRKALDELTSAGLFVQGPNGDHLIRDYLDYNPSSATIRARRKRDLERKRNPRGNDDQTESPF